MELSIIIVNWNSKDYLMGCLQSLRQHQPKTAYEVIVVDNASPAEDAAEILHGYPEIQLIKSPDNLGFARANNLGFEHARGEYLLFLNPDTEVIGSAVDNLVGQIRALPQAGVVGCKLLNTDRTVQLSAIQKFPSILGQIFDAEWLLLRWPGCPLWGLGPIFSGHTEAIQVDAISGACMLIRKEVFVQVGRFSEDYFMYAEDIDLSYTTAAAGFKNYYVGVAAIIHHGGKSSSRQEVKQWSTIMKCNAMLQYFSKFRGSLYGLVYRIAMGWVALGRLLLLCAVYPLGVILRRRLSLDRALRKWLAVLWWSLRMDAILSKQGH